MKTALQILALLLASGLCLRAFPADTVVIKTDDFQVTMDDFDNYLAAQGLTGDKRERALAQDGAVKRVFENLYLVRAYAARGAANPAIDKDAIDWLVQDRRERLLMNRQLELEVQQEIGSQDWDALAKEAFKANGDKYVSSERLGASHILIAFEGRTDEEALTRAREVLAKLDSGADFADLAKEYSDDKGSGARGGDLGLISRGRMVKPFENAAFALEKPGQLSEPVKTRYGYHIIRLNEYRPVRPLSYEEAQPMVMRDVKKRVEESITQRKINEVQTQLDPSMHVDLEVLEQLEQQYAPAQAVAP